MFNDGTPSRVSPEDFKSALCNVVRWYMKIHALHSQHREEGLKHFLSPQFQCRSATDKPLTRSLGSSGIARGERSYQPTVEGASLWHARGSNPSEPFQVGRNESIQSGIAQKGRDPLDGWLPPKLMLHPHQLCHC